MSLATALPITTLYTALLVLLFVSLGFRVAMFRIRNRIGVGFKGNTVFMQLSAAQTNAAENIPFALMLLMMMELQHAPAWALHLCGSVLLIARLIHAYGMSRHPGTSFGRRYGIITTWSLMLIMAVLNVYLAYS